MKKPSLESTPIERVAGYVRVSTEEQKLHGISVEAQTAALEKWARENGLKIAQYYNDAGFSARKPYNKRPAMVKLLEDVRAGKINLIVFTKLDRWFRSLPDYFKVQEILEKHKVNWRTIHEDYDTSTSSGRLKINIMLSVAQDEADRTSERIKAVFDVKREKLEPVSGRLPLGYLIAGKRIVKDPETEGLINDLFQKYMSCGSISVTQGFILEKYNFRMFYQRISKILNNPAYYGNMQGAEGMSPAYITKETFDRIQEMRYRIVRKTKENRVYLFSGLVSCGDCGRRMSISPSRGNASPTIKCRGHQVEKSGCQNGTCICERKVEAYLLDMIEPALRRIKGSYSSMAPAKEQRNHKQEIAQLKAKSAKLKDLYLNDLITLEECKAGQASITARINALAELEQPQRVPDFERIEKLLPSGWREMYQSVSREKKQEFWRHLLREIRIYPDRHITFEFNA